jgi:hypothetical protein
MMEVRKALEEANAIGSTANLALTPPTPASRPVLSLLRDYTAVRINFSLAPDPAEAAAGFVRVNRKLRHLSGISSDHLQ